MRCDRCGRDNPDHLRFCQDCGNSLAGPVAEATPPRGVELDRKSAAPAFDGGSTVRIHSRPSAPDFDFTPREEDLAPGATCGNCGVLNPLDSRFCSECGSSLGVAQAEPAPMPAPAAQAPAPAPPANPLVAAPVVDIAASGAAAGNEPPVVCGRCRGSNSPHMSFCQYCGARLGDQPPPPVVLGPVSAPRSSTSPEAPAARPPPTHRAAGSPEPAPAPGPVAPALGPPSAGPAATTDRFAPAELPGRPARLVVIAQDGTPGRDYALVEPQTDIGREEGTVLLPNDPYVSPRHARVFRRDGRFFVRDLDSVNGVYVRLRGPARLEHADLVLIGLEVLRFEVVSDAEMGLGPAAERGAQIFGSPASPRFARLCQRTVEGVTRNVFYLSADETVIGREAGDIVFTSDPFMSRRHALIRRDSSNVFTLQDLGSSNGTYLAIRGEVALDAGDHVRIGQHLFRLERSSRTGRKPDERRREGDPRQSVRAHRRSDRSGSTTRTTSSSPI